MTQNETTNPREQLEVEQASCRELIDRLRQFEGCAFQLEFLGPGGAPVCVPEFLQADLWYWLVRRLEARQEDCRERLLLAGAAPVPVEPPPSTEPPAVVAPTADQVDEAVSEEPAAELPAVAEPEVQAAPAVLDE